MKTITVKNMRQPIRIYAMAKFGISMFAAYKSAIVHIGSLIEAIQMRIILKVNLVLDIIWCLIEHRLAFVMRLKR